MEITPKAMEIEYIRIKRFNQEIEKVAQFENLGELVKNTIFVA